MSADVNSRPRIKPVAFGIAACVMGLTAVIVAGSIAFPRVGASLFFSWDSAIYIANARDYLDNGNLTSLVASYTQSFGNLAYPTNYNLLPTISLASSNGSVNPVAMYVLASALFFLSAFAIAAMAGFGAPTALVAGLAFVLLTMPFTSPPLYTNCFWWDSPSWIPLVYMFAALLVTFWSVGRMRPLANVLAILLLCCEVFAVIVGPAKAGFLVLFGIAWYCTALTLFPDSRRELVWKAAAAIAVAAFALGSGLLNFVHGLYAYTGNMLFPASTLESSGPLALLKIFFGEWYVAWLKANLGYSLTLLAVLGALWTAVSPPTPTARRLAVASLAIAPVLPFFLWGGVIAGTLYPLLAVFATVLVFRSVRAAYVFIAHRFSGRAVAAAIEFMSGKPVISLVAISALAFGLAVAPRHMAAPAGFRFPPLPHPLTDRLTADLRFSPGDQFRGRYADMSITLPLEDGTLPRGDTLSAGLMKTAYDHAVAYGNDLTIFGPRYFDIPVAGEANRMNTPVSVLFHSFLLIDERQPDRVDFRNITHFDKRLFGLLGIRYVLSHRPPADASVKLVDMPRLPQRTLLYDLGQVNIGQYSPTAVTMVADWRPALEKMAGADFDPARSALIHDPWLNTDALTPASDARIMRTRAGYRVSATSRGRSLLVLPFEFSRCVTVKDHGAATRTGRVDFMLTGITFEGSIDSELRFGFGPFENSGCRLDDLADVQAMNLNPASFAEFRKKYPNRFQIEGIF